MKLKSIISNFLNPAYAPVMAHKLKMRLLNQTIDKKAQAASLAWCEEVAEDCEPFALGLNAELWAESKAFAEQQHDHARRKLENLDASLNGPGHYPLLYFITRYRNPEVVVETGVAAGFSTRALLTALKLNGRGHLYSSDFPYFRLENPEKFIAVLVEEELKTNWNLYLEGDRKNLEKILNLVSKVDLFHYDSDKTHAGRAFAMSMMQHVLTDDSVIIMDDIQDNLFFHDYVKQQGCRYKVFSFEGKYLGAIGL